MWILLICKFWHICQFCTNVNIFNTNVNYITFVNFTHMWIRLICKFLHICKFRTYVNSPYPKFCGTCFFLRFNCYFLPPPSSFSPPPSLFSLSSPSPPSAPLPSSALFRSYICVDKVTLMSPLITTSLLSTHTHLCTGCFLAAKITSKNYICVDHVTLKCMALLGPWYC